MDLPGRDFEVKAIECLDPTEILMEIDGLDDRVHGPDVTQERRPCEGQEGPVRVRKSSIFSDTCCGVEPRGHRI
ncbi:hypothetical protein StoSoilB5_03590 [Arthrobacter sp. StoSoilB5]|nr:hypothetical protein StoSoilB5_03590 [Arthrobacter sp. StoSoilB5]